MNSIYGMNQGERTAQSNKRGGKRGIRQRVIAGKQSPVKMLPNHTVTGHGIEIGPFAVATRHPDGSKRTGKEQFGIKREG